MHSQSVIINKQFRCYYALLVTWEVDLSVTKTNMIDYLNTLNVQQHKLSLRSSLACYAVVWCVCQALLCLLCDHVNI